MTIIGEAFVAIKPDSKGFEGEAENGVLGSVGNLASKAKLLMGGAIAGAVTKGIMEFARFESSMNEVFTLLPGISQQAMDSMTGQVKDFSREFGVLPDKVVPALYQSLSAGVPPDNVFAFLETAQMAAKGGVTDLTTAVDGISSAVNAYGADVLDAGRASDLMFTAVKGGKTTFAELSQALFQVNPIASSLGVNFGDVTAALAAMTAQGIPTSVATTQLRQAFVEMSKEGSKTSETFQKVAGVGFKEFIAGGGNVQDALQLLEEHANETGVGINDLFGSVEAGSAALALTGKGTEKFSQELRNAADSAGATKGAFDQMNQGIGPLFDKVRAFAAVALIELGDAVANAAYWLAERLGPSLQTVGGIITTVAPIVQDVLATGLRIAGEALGFLAEVAGNPVFQVLAGVIGLALVPALIQMGVQATITAAQTVAAWLTMQAQAIAGAASNILQLALAGAKWVWMGITALASAAQVAAAWIISMGPIALVVGAVIAAAVLIVKNWDWIKETVGNVVDAVTGFLGRAVDAVAGFASGVGAWISNAIGTILGFKDQVWGVVSAVIGFFARMASGAGEQLGQLVSWVAGVPGRILGALGDLGGLLYNAGLAIMRGLRDGIVAGFRAVADFVGGIASKIASLKGPLDYDRRLLIPAGHAIMDSLDRGLAEREAALRARLKAITSMIEAVGPASDSVTTTGRTAPDAGGVPAVLVAEIRALTAAVQMLASNGGARGNWSVTGTDPVAVAGVLERRLNWRAGG